MVRFRHKSSVTGVDFIRDLAVVMMVAGITGWVCQRLQLSVIVGYLLAGVIIGPYTPPFQLVTDIPRIKMLSELGLVFLIFSIGLGLSLRRLQRLGMSVIIATLVSSVLILNGCRLLSAALDLTSTQGLFLAAALMVSSSAIISKVLEEINANHTRAGQLALGITVLEDVVAVVMLTLLTSLIKLDADQSPSVFITVGAFAGFAVMLGILALLLVPKLLKSMNANSNAELRMLVIVGLLLSLGLLAVKAGYSLALAAFVLGAIIGSTRQKAEMERLFEGVRHIFGALFFVAMGMLFNVTLLPDIWLAILGLTLVVVIGRPLGAALGLMSVGNSLRESVRAGLAVTPLGEFSFIIASISVEEHIMPESFYAMAVGTSLLTSLTAPVMIRHSETISDRVENSLPKALREWIVFYHEWLDQLLTKQQSSILWKLTAKRLVQTAAQFLFVSGALIVAEPIYSQLKGWLGTDWLFPNGLPLIFWTSFGLLLLAPMVAVWRNISALSLIFAEAATRKHKRRRLLSPLLENAIKTVTALFTTAWLLALAPASLSNLWVMGSILVIMLIAAAIFWRRLVRLHSRVEIELQEQLKSATKGSAQSNWSVSQLEEDNDWGLQIDEITLPDDSAHAGKPIKSLPLRRELGCSIIGIDRGGYAISNPSADERLYPGDKLLIMGKPDKLPVAAGYLNQRGRVVDWQDSFDELNTETVTIPHTSQAVGQTLEELDLIRRFHIQLGGIQRGGKRGISPSGNDKLEGGDQLLVLGTHENIRQFERWLEPEDPAKTKP